MKPKNSSQNSEVSSQNNVNTNPDKQLPEGVLFNLSTPTGWQIKSSKLFDILTSGFWLLNSIEEFRFISSDMLPDSTIVPLRWLRVNISHSRPVGCVLRREDVTAGYAGSTTRPGRTGRVSSGGYAQPWPQRHLPSWSVRGPWTVF